MSHRIYRMPDRMSEYVSLGECHLVEITKWSNSSWKSYQGRCLAQIRKVLLLLRPAAVWLVDLCGHLWHLWPSCRLLLISVNNVNIYQYVKWKFKWSLMNMNTGSDSRGYGPVCFFSLNTEWSWVDGNGISPGKPQSCKEVAKDPHGHCPI